MNPSKPIATQPAPNTEPPEHGPLGVFDAMNIIIGIVIGTVIFKTAPMIFNSSGSPSNALLIWAIGGVLAFVGALCYAELATSYPKAGGDYVYLTRAFGPWAGFLFGWTQLVIVMTCSIGAMAVVFGEYATQLYDLSDKVQFGGLSSLFLYAAGAIIVITLLNLIGVVLGKLVQNLLTILKIAGVIAIIVAGFWKGDWAANGPQTWEAPHLPDWGAGMPSVAMILVMYAFGGWNDAAFVAAEVRDPRRNIPRALLLGVGVITVLYLLINLAYVVGLGYHGAANPGGQLIPLTVLNQAFGDVAQKVLNVVIMIAALGAVNGLIFTGARVYGTLAKDYRLFGFMGHWQPGRGAPIMALLLQAIITLSMVAAFGTLQGEDAVNTVLAKVSDVRNQIYGAEPGSKAAIDLRIAPTFRKTAAAKEEVEEIDVEKLPKMKKDDDGVEIAPMPAPGGPAPAPAPAGAPGGATGERIIDADATFNKLFAVSAPFFWIFFLATGLSLFVLRKPKEERPFSVPLYPILPIIFCNMCVWMLYRSFEYVALSPFGPNLGPVVACFVVLVLIGLPLGWIAGYRGATDD